jgi:long-chain fatty acid transport protein
MKTPKKIVLTGLACCFYVSGLLAGGILTNTNQSVHFLRNPARGASLEIDGVYTNPAGLIKLPTNGLHFSLNNQSAFQTRTITSSCPTFAGFGGSDTKAYEGKAKALAIPSIMFAYKKDSWAISGYIGVIGGGGKLAFDKGLPSFETPISLIPFQLSAGGVPTNKYAVDASFEGTSYLFAGQLGATFAFSEMLSVYAGARLNFASNGYIGHLKGISVNPTHPALNPSGNMMLANTFFTNAKQAAQGAASSLQPAINGGAGQFTLDQMVAAGQMTQAQVDQ